MVFLGRRAKTVEHDAGLDACDAALRIDFENPCHVLRKVENDCGVATLSGE
jgi:hypothetical protein